MLDFPQVVYDKDGDCIEFITVDEDFKARRLNSMLTVYIGRESGDIVGSLIKGCSLPLVVYLLKRERMPPVW